MRTRRVFVVVAAVAVVSLGVAGAFAWAAGSGPTHAAGSPSPGPPDRSFGVRSGVNRLSLSVVQAFGVTPPAILFQTVPARLDCRVLSYDYSAHEASFRPPPIGTLTMSLKCGRTPPNAAVRLHFRAPIQRVFELHNGPASMHVVLDTPRGNVLPLMELGVRPPSKANCRTLGQSFFRRGEKFALTIRGHCSGLRRGSESVVSIGGLLLDRSASSSSSSSAADSSPTASAAVFKSLEPTVDQKVPVCSLTAGEIRARCTQRLEMWFGRTYSQEYSQDCPFDPAYHYVSNGGYPGWDYTRIPDVGPSEDHDVFGLWSFTFWGIVRPPVKLELSWNCDLGSPVNLHGPILLGAAVVGRAISCHRGVWSTDVTGFAYQWFIGFVPINGATGTEYTPTQTDHRSHLTCRVTATNLATAKGVAQPTAVESGPSEPVVKGPPRVGGGPALVRLDEITGGESGAVPPYTATTNTRIKCKRGFWVDAFSFSYQWLADLVPIPGATGDVYRPQYSDVGKSLTCRERATNPAGSTDATSAASGPVQAAGGGIL